MEMQSSATVANSANLTIQSQPTQCRAPILLASVVIKQSIQVHQEQSFATTSTRLVAASSEPNVRSPTSSLLASMAKNANSVNNAILAAGMMYHSL